jgi:hypothetical protein
VSIDEKRLALMQQLSELEQERDAAQVDSGPRTIPMDTEDKLRLENILLRERLIDRERKDARDALHASIVAKYKVNTALEAISMNANTGIIEVTTK